MVKGLRCFIAVGLFRQAHASQEIGEARITSQRVESGIHPDEIHSIRTSKICLVEPREGPLFVTQGGVDTGYVVTADVALAGFRFDTG